MHDTVHLSYWQENSPLAAIQNFNSHSALLMDLSCTMPQPPHWRTQQLLGTRHDAGVQKSAKRFLIPRYKQCFNSC